MRKLENNRRLGVIAIVASIVALAFMWWGPGLIDQVKGADIPSAAAQVDSQTQAQSPTIRSHSYIAAGVFTFEWKWPESGRGQWLATVYFVLFVGCFVSAWQQWPLGKGSILKWIFFVFWVLAGLTVLNVWLRLVGNNTSFDKIFDPLYKLVKFISDLI